MATATMVLVALMSQAGFTGNIRYLTIPIALTGIVGAAGLVRLGRLAWARLGPRWAVVAITLGAARRARRSPPMRSPAPATRCAAASTRRALYAALPDAVARAGGRAAVLRCGSPITHDFDTQTVARALRVHQDEVANLALVPGTILARRGSHLAGDPHFPHRLAITAALGHHVVLRALNGAPRRTFGGCCGPRGSRTGYVASSTTARLATADLSRPSGGAFTGRH